MSFLTINPTILLVIMTNIEKLYSLPKKFVTKILSKLVRTGSVNEYFWRIHFLLKSFFKVKFEHFFLTQLKNLGRILIDGRLYIHLTL